MSSSSILRVRVDVPVGGRRRVNNAGRFLCVGFRKTLSFFLFFFCPRTHTIKMCFDIICDSDFIFRTCIIYYVVLSSANNTRSVFM